MTTNDRTTLSVKDLSAAEVGSTDAATAPTLLDWAAGSAGEDDRDVYILAQANEESRATDEHAADEHGEALHADDSEAHADEGAAGFRMPQEFPNIYTLIASMRQKEGEHHGEDEAGHHGPFWLNPLFAIVYATAFVVIVHRCLRHRSIENPSRAQVAVEALFEGLLNFFGDIVGKAHARQFVPFVGSLWLFILLNNLMGLVPLLKSPTGHFEITIGLGICTFLYVNYQGIKAGGIRHYIWHLCGSPTDVVGWGMVPMMLPLEIIGTLIKPVSLSLRLYGNIFGEDKLLASFLGLGMMVVAIVFDTASPPIGLPLHLPFLFLATLTSIIQATVFAMLTAVYIAMLLPHEHDEHDEHVKNQDGVEPIAA